MVKAIYIDADSMTIEVVLFDGSADMVREILGCDGYDVAVLSEDTDKTRFVAYAEPENDQDSTRYTVHKYPAYFDDATLKSFALCGKFLLTRCLHEREERYIDIGVSAAQLSEHLQIVQQK